MQASDHHDDQQRHARRVFQEDPRNAFGETTPADRIGGDETGATTGVQAGEAPIIPDVDRDQPVGNDPTVPGGGHGEGP